MGEKLRARFMVSRVVLSGRGSVNGPDEQASDPEHVYQDRRMSLREVVAELGTFDELSCPKNTITLAGSEYALTKPRRVDGWDEHEILFIRRGDGRPVSGRVLHRLFFAAELLTRRIGGGL